jgi:hypothetical protein
MLSIAIFYEKAKLTDNNDTHYYVLYRHHQFAKLLDELIGV